MTEEDLWYFKINGFYRIPETLPAVLVGRLNGATDEQIEEMAEPIVWENKDTRTPSAVRRLSKALNRDRVYQEAGSQPIILDALEDILGPNVELLTNKHNHVLVKPSGAYPVPWHSGEQPLRPGADHGPDLPGGGHDRKRLCSNRPREPQPALPKGPTPSETAGRFSGQRKLLPLGADSHAGGGHSAV